MGDDVSGKMERFIVFFIGDGNGNVFNGRLRGDVNLVDFVFFFSLISQGVILVKNYWSKEDLDYLNNKKGSKKQKWMTLTGYFLPQEFNDKPTLRDIPF